MEHQENTIPTLAELWALVQNQQAHIVAQSTEITALKAKISTQQANIQSSPQTEKEITPAPREHRISRAALLKAAAASVTGITAVALTGPHGASAAPATTTDTNFVATGTGNAAIPGFDATASNQFNEGVSANGIACGVLGTSTNGYGVRGDSTNNHGVVGTTTSNGFFAGVRGYAGTLGYGGWFQGGGAPLHLEPSPSIVGHPTTGSFLKGDIFVDQNGTIWVCIVDGTPGTWRRIVTHS